MTTPYNRRRIIDFVVNLALSLILMASGAGLWALLTAPISLWNYYDGKTRASLEGSPKK